MLRPVLVLLTAVALAGCGAASDGGAADATRDSTVTVETFEFQPDPIVVPRGSTITFINKDAIDHTVTAGTREEPEPRVFDGRLPTKGSTFDVTLDEAGTYDYF